MMTSILDTMPTPQRICVSKTQTEEDRLEAEVQTLLRQSKKKKKDKKKGKKKDKKKKHDVSVQANFGGGGAQKEDLKSDVNEGGQYPESDINEDGRYSYDLLLERVYSMLERDNPDRYSKQPVTRLTLPPLNLTRYKTTRTCWSNFVRVCKSMMRPPDHVMRFLENELAMRTSINGHQQLIVPTRIESRGLKLILDRYVKQYVLCIRCQSYRTTIRKDQVRRLSFVQCDHCHAETSVPLIKTGIKGHVALKRGDRYRSRHSLHK
jgi:translation initiation factor 2 subunit 2